ncbi:MAG: YwbE family protein [Clostridiales bacterium]|nr:YwbE family protein [Clostridiales bacterium]
MSGNKRSDISVGSQVSVVQKHHQRTEQLTNGIVEKLLTKSDYHPHGIKVRLKSGLVGRVKIVQKNDNKET